MFFVCVCSCVCVREVWMKVTKNIFLNCNINKGMELGVDRLSAWPIIGADIKHFTDYRYRPFSKQICR